MNLKINLWQKLKLLVTFVFGDMTDITGWVLGWFNDSVLQKINDKTEASLYCHDVKDFVFFLKTIFTRHQMWMAKAKREAFLGVIHTFEGLATALEDLKVTQEELTELVRLVRKAIKAWKEA